eukprot:CAMPEP_0167767844 /NCGR_PEP_ID=MMETSP0110_2-20121227/16299_1 /TAXON_ID=629695 /ORGANISM="Gymnochlora sp., Strain CCMP2014" /LENGTH=378 /DNA_ID=CAMNT_0007656375 /DNA_START=530 /DNA_END=1666 /DNA_ORIENTATION=-
MKTSLTFFPNTIASSEDLQRDMKEVVETRKHSSYDINEHKSSNPIRMARKLIGTGSISLENIKEGLGDKVVRASSSENTHEDTHMTSSFSKSKRAGKNRASSVTVPPKTITSTPNTTGGMTVSFEIPLPRRSESVSFSKSVSIQIRSLANEDTTKAIKHREASTKDSHEEQPDSRNESPRFSDGEALKFKKSLKEKSVSTRDSKPPSPHREDSNTLKPHKSFIMQKLERKSRERERLRANSREGKIEKRIGEFSRSGTRDMRTSMDLSKSATRGSYHKGHNHTARQETVKASAKTRRWLCKITILIVSCAVLIAGVIPLCIILGYESARSGNARFSDGIQRYLPEVDAFFYAILACNFFFLYYTSSRRAHHVNRGTAI